MAEYQFTKGPAWHRRYHEGRKDLPKKSGNKYDVTGPETVLSLVWSRTR